jgi:hypothetical protein
MFYLLSERDYSQRYADLQLAIPDQQMRKLSLAVFAASKTLHYRNKIGLTAGLQVLARSENQPRRMLLTFDGLKKTL